MQQVLQCDLDIVWLRDPFPLFATHPHLAAADVPQLVCVDGRGAVCAVCAACGVATCMQCS